MIRYLLFFLLLPSIAFSHELKPAIANLNIQKNEQIVNVKIDIQLNLEAILANIDPSHADTDESKNASYYNDLRKLKPEELKSLFFKNLKDFNKKISLKSDNKDIDLKIDEIVIDNIGNIEVSRKSNIFLSGKGIDEDNLKFGWNQDYGPIILRVLTSKDSLVYTEYLKINSVSKNFSIYKKNNDNLFSDIINYLIIGFEHIVPKGLDHILFVIGLFLFSPKMKPLIIQVSAFTLAHTITIFLGVLEIVKLSGQIVEPIIALSISYVAVENIIFKKVSLWRPIVIFAFGLLHGLGFAGVISEIGLSQTNFILTLISFNVGVEFGQLFVILVCFGIAYWIKEKMWYKKYFTNPLSMLIAIIGLYWFFERVI